jgi:NAD(P)-dependent dehydrogenase (short-subunit alcohol dehydrogenase family)
VALPRVRMAGGAHSRPRAYGRRRRPERQGRPPSARHAPPARSLDRMTWDPRQLGELTGRTVLITGATSGIGLAAARDLVGRGADVLLAVRDVDKGERIRAQLPGPGTATVVPLDVADLDQVAAAAKAVLDSTETLSALVLNAGLMGGPHRLSPQGFELQMATNHFGHAALVSALWPLLHASGSRVVVVSSLAARGGGLSPTTTVDQLVAPSPYVAQRVYSTTKQANLLFALELARRAGRAGSPVSAVAVHPGLSDTDLFVRHLPGGRRSPLVPAVKAVSRLVLQSSAAGALPTLRGLDHSTPSGAFVGPRGLGQMRGRPELLDLPSTAQDPATAEHLWELTEQVLDTPLPV